MPANAGAGTYEEVNVYTNMHVGDIDTQIIVAAHAHT